MLRPLHPSDIESIAGIWNAACGPEFAITPHFAEYNTRPTTGALQAGRMAMQAGQPVGFVLASALPASPDVSPPEMGWIDAIAIVPAFQRRGVGSELLAWAESWLAQQGCAYALPGGSLRPWTPGVPIELGSRAFFESHGYQGQPWGNSAWDLAHDLRDYRSKTYQTDARIQPGQPGEEEAVLAFLKREFPDRWRFEFAEFLKENGRMSDYTLLWTERGVDGCCRVTFEDSERPLDRYYLHHLLRPWGQLGSIGVSADCRGKGYGSALLDGGLRHLRDKGIRGCVIDWTTLVDWYGKFGFKPYHQFAMLFKTMKGG